jgi:hypothetical protein
MATRKEPDVGPAQAPSDAAVRNAERAQVPVTPAADAAPPAVSDPPPAGAGKGITVADVAALQGVQVAPDASHVEGLTVDEARSEGVFISEGMRNDLLQQGYTHSPLDGRLILTQETADKVKAARSQ